MSEGHHEHSSRELDGFRVVITGKGGVGKTTLTALLGGLLARRGFRVLAVDSDPQMNLPYAMGMADADDIVPLSNNADYVEEKTGARPGEGWGLLFRLNPDVRDVVDRFAAPVSDGVQVLVMGTLTQPAAGCLCPENSLLDAVVGNLALRTDEVILMDTQAGVEHFGRALAQGFHQAIVLSDPTFNGINVALRTAELARGLNIPAVHLVVNRVRTPKDIDRTFERVAHRDVQFTSRHTLPYDERLLEVEPDVNPFLDGEGSSFMDAVAVLRDTLIHTEQELS
jgi:CO dehydrogenase maturation factor